jgi:2-polyprenyl-3-methyl-5-hydroxy-6-metoxy-1,4-benzoquinol methylase
VELKYRNQGNTALLELVTQRRGWPGRVLDCGCGAGDNALILQDAGWRVTAITMDPVERDAAEPYCESVVVADLELGIPAEVGNGYDVILMSHVLEHVVAPERLLAAARERLADSGVIAVALPNVVYYRQRLRFLFGDFTYTETGVLDRTHLRFYTVVTARALLTGAGYRIVDYRADGGLPWMALRRFIPTRWRRRVEGWALRRWPGLFAWQILFVAEREEGQISAGE